MLIVVENIWVKQVLLYLKPKDMFNQLSKYDGLNSYDLLKSIAVITMIIDHIGLYFFPDIELFRVVGRMSYLLFAFCAGYNQKYSFDKSLFGFAILISVGNFIIDEADIISIFQGSILISLVIIRLFMRYAFIISKKDRNLLGWFVILWFLSAPTHLLFSYGSAGIAIAICGYLCATEKNRLVYLSFLISSFFLYFILESISFMFSWFFMTILFIEILMLILLLKDFFIYKVTYSKVPSVILLFCSRYALAIYFFHYEFLKIISLYI